MRHHNQGRPVPGYSFAIDREPIGDNQIVAMLEEYRMRREFINGGGYQKLSVYLLRDYGYIVNPKKVYRLCKENHLLLPKKKKRKRTIRRAAINRTITSPNRLWELDIKYGYIDGENRFFFIMPIIDVYSRLIVNYHIGLTCKGTDLALTLKIALEKHNVSGNQLTIRNDNGSQMTSKAFMSYVKSLGEEEVVQEFIPPATPNKTAHIEAFNSIFEIEFLQARYFFSYGQAYEETVDFFDIYNTVRIHGSLKNRTPKEIHDSFEKGDGIILKGVTV